VGSTPGAAAIAALIDRTIDTTVPEPFGAYLFLDGDPAAEIARSVEREVFLEAFGNTAELLATEYGPYEPSSLFVCVVDHRARRPAGAMRLIVPTPGGPGLKSLNDLEPTWGAPATALLSRLGIAPPPGGMWDIATLAVAPAYRTAAATGLVSLGLYQSVVRTAGAAGIEWLCAILDVTVFRMTRAKFAGPFDPITDPRPYLGSPSSVPVTCDLVAWRARLSGRDQLLCETIYDGLGIEAALRPLPLTVAAGLSETLVRGGGAAPVSRPTPVGSTVPGGSRAERAR
jgi:hypothetical protein